MQFPSPMTCVLLLGAFTVSACDPYAVPARDRHFISSINDLGSSPDLPDQGAAGAGGGAGTGGDGGTGAGGGSGTGGDGGTGGGGSNSDNGDNGSEADSDDQNCSSSPGATGKKTKGLMYPVPAHAKGKPPKAAMGC